MRKVIAMSVFIGLICTFSNFSKNIAWAVQKNLDTNHMVLRESKDMSTPTYISQDLMYSPDGNIKNEVRVGYATISCDSYTRDVSFIREVSPGLDSLISKTRSIDGIEYKSINNVDEQTAGRQFTDILYSEDGVKGGFVRKEVKPIGMPIIDPRQYCQGGKAVPMTQSVAVELYNGLGPIFYKFEEKLKERKGFPGK